MCDAAKAFQSCFEALDNFRGDLIGWRQQIGIAQRVVLQPEDIEFDLVAGEQRIRRKAPELFAFLALEEL